MNKAFYAVDEKKQQTLRQGQGDGYQPIVSLSPKKSGNTVGIRVKDNGNGIPEKLKTKSFNPSSLPGLPDKGQG